MIEQIYYMVLVSGVFTTAGLFCSAVYYWINK
jgi:hypothetical protein